MTDRELLAQALEALEEISGGYSQNLIVALRERLAQPQRTHWEGCEEVHPECRKPETVMAEYKFQTYAAYKTDGGEMKIGVVPDDAPLMLNGVPLYPRREWVGLTDEEVSKLIDNEIGFNSCWGPEEQFARAIEAKLKEKNNG